MNLPHPISSCTPPSGERPCAAVDVGHRLEHLDRHLELLWYALGGYFRDGSGMVLREGESFLESVTTAHELIEELRELVAGEGR